METQILEKGKKIYLLSAVYSCIYPELVPKKIKNDPLLHGKKSIRIFCQNEIRPQKNVLYQATIEEILITNKYSSKGRRKIYIFTKNIVRIISSYRKNIIIQNDRRFKRRNINDDFFIWEAR